MSLHNACPPLARALKVLAQEAPCDIFRCGPAPCKEKGHSVAGHECQHTLTGCVRIDAAAKVPTRQFSPSGFNYHGESIKGSPSLQFPFKPFTLPAQALLEVG